MSAGRRPNVLFLMTDHTSAQAIAPGSQCLTPGLDTLAGEGVRFGRCYTTNAICSPARASLMTGLFPSAHGTWDCTHTQRREWVDTPPDRFTYFSNTFAQHGYATGYFGKWHVEQSQQLECCGWQEYDLGCGGLKPQTIPGADVVVRTPGYRDCRLAGCATDASVGTHPAFDRGIEFIRRQARGDRPFFCFVSTQEPHDPYLPPQRFLSRYDLAALQLSPTLHDQPAGKPEVVSRMRAVWQGMTDDQWRRTTAAYWAMVSFLDSEVGRILAALRECGAWENTIVAFTSDHGDMLGGHGLATKGVGTAYEEVYNIPLVLRVPGAPARGELASPLVSIVDLAPTLLDLCGLPPLPSPHGRSLRPLLDGSAEPEGWQDAYAEFFGQRFVYTQRIVWHRTWKYVFSPGGIDELYDLAADPFERRNLAAEPAQRETLLAMARRMWRWMARVGDESLRNTHYATLRTAPIGPLAAEGDARVV